MRSPDEAPQRACALWRAIRGSCHKYGIVPHFAMSASWTRYGSMRATAEGWAAQPR